MSDAPETPEEEQPEEDEAKPPHVVLEVQGVTVTTSATITPTE